MGTGLSRTRRLVAAAALAAVVLSFGAAGARGSAPALPDPPPDPAERALAPAQALNRTTGRGARRRSTAR